MTLGDKQLSNRSLEKIKIRYISLIDITLKTTF